jgi:hypothetical protein
LTVEPYASLPAYPAIIIVVMNMTLITASASIVKDQEQKSDGLEGI